MLDAGPLPLRVLREKGQYTPLSLQAQRRNPALELLLALLLNLAIKSRDDGGVVRERRRGLWHNSGGV